MLFNGKNELFFQRKFIHEKKNFREFVMAMNSNNRHPGVKLLYSVSFDWISQFTPILLEKRKKRKWDSGTKVIFLVKITQIIQNSNKTVNHVN